MSGRGRRAQQRGRQQRAQDRQHQSGSGWYEQRHEPTGQELDLIHEMKAELRRHQDAMEAALPRGVSPQQIMQDAYQCLLSTKDLPLVYRPSFVAALLTCARLGIRPGGPLGHGWILPFRNWLKNGRYEAQLIIGYKGYADLAYRHPRVVGVASHIVRERDTFEIDLGKDDLTHKLPPPGVPRGRAIAFYAFAKIQGPYGTERILTEPMSVEEMEEHRDKHAMFKEWQNGRKVVAGPWRDNFEEMGRKTPVRLRLPKAAMPVALDLATAFAVDEGVRYDLDPEADPAKVTEHPGDEPPPLDPRAPVRDSVTIHSPDRRGGITPEQDRRIARLMRQRGMSRDDALNLVEATIGERLTARQLNEEQAARVIAAIQAVPPDPIDGTVIAPSRESAERRIASLFDRMDAHLGAEERLRDLSRLLGRTISVPADVTVAELDDIADVLTACKGQTSEWHAALRAAASQRSPSERTP